MHTELKGQVNELSLDIKQLCIVPISIHFFENKFWSYIVTKDVGRIRDAIIYGRPISNSSMNADMEESYTLQFINFSSIMIKQRDTFPQPLLVKISLDLITNVTDKLPCSSRLVPLIIPFDRG